MRDNPDGGKKPYVRKAKITEAPKRVVQKATIKRQSPPTKSMSRMVRKTNSKPVPLGGVKKKSTVAKNTGGLAKRTAKKMTPTNIKGFANGRKTI